VLFSEALGQFRDMLEPGLAVLLQLGAELQGEDVRARINNVELLDQAAAKTSMGLKIFVRDDKPIESISKRLEKIQRGGSGPRPSGASGAPGEVTLVMLLDLETEVEMKLPGHFKISPQIAGALKAVAGVEKVETV
jgi:DNA polymerase-3 subunit alpha